MKSIAYTCAALVAALAAPAQTRAADDAPLQRLALCQDTWLAWQDDPARMAQLVNHFDARFARDGQDGGLTPKSALSVLGWPVARVYPQSVGMGVGFSMIVNADFAKTRAGIEQQLGKRMACETSDGERSCEVRLGDRKTAVLVTGQNGQATTSLIGCYYFYQQ